MSERVNIFLVGIVICLAFIALKPVPVLNVPLQQPPSFPIGDEVIYLGDNTLAVIDKNQSSGTYGHVRVYQINREDGSMKQINHYNYQDIK